GLSLPDASDDVQVGFHDLDGEPPQVAGQARREQHWRLVAAVERELAQVDVRDQQDGESAEAQEQRLEMTGIDEPENGEAEQEAGDLYATQSGAAVSHARAVNPSAWKAEYINPRAVIRPCAARRV